MEEEGRKDGGRVGLPPEIFVDHAHGAMVAIIIDFRALKDN